MMKFIRKEHKGTTFHFFENDNLIFGYSEIDAQITHIEEYFNAIKTIQLDQVHGNKIYFSNKTAGYPEGDGVILNEKEIIAVIRTADCVPLFFWTKYYRFAGIIHVGWQGIYSQIGINLLKLLKNEGVNPEDLFFFTGPAIEGKCYTVRQDLVDKFKDFSFSDKIFHKTPNGYSMDIIKGITICLARQGVSPENIYHSNICTFCSKNFPSFRRGNREERIFNFMLIK